MLGRWDFLFDPWPCQKQTQGDVLRLKRKGTNSNSCLQKSSRTQPREMACECTNRQFSTNITMLEVSYPNFTVFLLLKSLYHVLSPFMGQTPGSSKQTTSSLALPSFGVKPFGPYRWWCPNDPHRSTGVQAPFRPVVALRQELRKDQSSSVQSWTPNLRRPAVPAICLSKRKNINRVVFLGDFFSSFRVLLR